MLLAPKTLAMRCVIGVFLCTQLVLTLTSTSASARDSSSSRSAFSCDDLVVAGAGTGGLYSAWRLIEAGLVDPSKTCILEQTNRIGKCSGRHLENVYACLHTAAVVAVDWHRAWLVCCGIWIWLPSMGIRKQSHEAGRRATIKLLENTRVGVSAVNILLGICVGGVSGVKIKRV